MFKTIRDYDFSKKDVLLRLDLNVPIKDGKIKDDSRILAALPTINYLLQRGCKIVACSHLGRPKGGPSPEFSLSPVAKKLQELLKENKVIFANDVVGEDAQRKFSELKAGEVLLLENVRFEPGETKGDEELAKKFRTFGEIYVTDAFGSLHRAHSSVYQTPKLFDVVLAGFLVEKEIIYLKEKLESPERPYIAILGGAKVSDKIPVLKGLIEKVDGMIIGGAMAYTFLSSKGFDVGNSLVEQDCFDVAKEIMKRAEERKIPFLLPIDHISAKSIEDTEVKVMETISEGYSGFDIGPKTIALFKNEIIEAKTIVWNGPLGVFEKEQFKNGTVSIAKALADCSSLKIVGGGDSVSAIKVAGVEDKITHISTGGGASLELIAGEKLPGVEILYEKGS
jgi:phosphoglycerate kinase